MILLTLGTHGQPFERALELLARLAGTDEFLIQHGSTRPRFDLLNAEWVDYLESDDLVANMRRASVVISHAGVGTMITAVRNGKSPVVLPRLARFGEHVDDHQLQLAERFAAEGLVVVCGPNDCIESCVREARNRRRAVHVPRNTGLREAVAELALLASERRARIPPRRRSRLIVSRWTPG